MKKYLWIILIIVILIIGGLLYFYFNKSDSSTPYTAEKSNLNTNINNNSGQSQNSVNNSNTSTNNSNENKTSEQPIKTEKIVEKEIATFSTKISNKKDSNRQENISITCSKLNNTTVEPGNTFSFCNTIGKATSDKGYQEANVIIQGTETKALGGGNCQISSTLYNAVLSVPELEVTERHPHSAPVPYIETGKDAAVSYRFS